MKAVFDYLTSLGFVHLKGDLAASNGPDEEELWIHWERQIVVNVSPGMACGYETEKALSDAEDATLDELLIAAAE